MAQLLPCSFSALEEKTSNSRTDCFNHGRKIHPTQMLEGLVDFRAGVEAVVKNYFLSLTLEY